MNDPLIAFEGVTKQYHVVRRATPKMGAWVVNKLFEHLRREPFYALHDVSFTVPKGEMIGFLGTNGAGKSTLLKLIAGITQPTSGTVRVRGRIASMLELGVGFHPELSGMENIFYNGQIMGLSREQVFGRLSSIIQFSGLENFLYEAVKHYSSGMYARLAMSVALHLDPDIILMDEILAVGDAEFQQRGMMKVLEMHGAGVTIALVTHVMTAAREMCERLIWLDHGRIRADGSAREVMREYRWHIADLALPEDHFRARGRAIESERDEKAPRIAGTRVLCGQGEPGIIITGGAARFEIDVEGDETPFKIAISARWTDGRVLFEDESEALQPGAGPVVYEVPYWPFLRANMVWDVALVSVDDPQLIYDRRLAMEFETRTDEEYALEDIVMSPRAAWSVV